MKWVLIAIVAVSPIETGMAFDTHAGCQLKARAFLIDYTETRNTALKGPFNVPEPPKYACVPRATPDHG